MGRHVAAGGLETDLWLLKRWLYGQRKAPQAWTDWHASVLMSMEFEQDPACPAIFYSESRSIVIDAHADDEDIVGPPGNVKWFQDKYTAITKCKDWCEHQIRVRSRSEKGLWILPNSST